MKTQRIAGIVVQGVLGAGLVLSQGCGTVAGTAKPAVSPGTQAVETVNPTAAESFARLLNVGASYRAEGDISKSVAVSLVNAAEGALAQKEFRVDNKAADLSVEVAVKIVLFDQSGDYFRYNGEVDATVTRAGAGKVLGRQAFRAEGPRALGSQAALRGVSDKLTPELNKWLLATCTSARAELGAEDVVVRRRLPSLASGDPAYALEFADAVGKVEGVVSCKLVAQDYAARTMTFRVVYDKNSFAGGFMNRLMTIEKLGLKAGK